MSKQTRSEQKVWIYQYRNSKEKEWNSFYSFAEVEFFQEDFEVINRFTSWDARQKGNYWVVGFVRNGETFGLPFKIEGEDTNNLLAEDVHVIGKIMFVNDVVKLNMGGRTRVIDSFNTEDERLAGLKKYFSISLI